jgi:FlaG/FlaF family flagellin (archaellin)
MPRVAGRAGVGALLVVALAVVLGGVASGSGGGHGHGKDRTIRVVERATTDTPVDLGTTGDSIGDLLAFGNELFDEDNQVKVGTDQGSCVRTVVGEAYECSWTNSLAKGQISVQGPFLDGGDSVLAITGGTGAYRDARGTMSLHSVSATEIEFTFHLSGGGRGRH